MPGARADGRRSTTAEVAEATAPGHDSTTRHDDFRQRLRRRLVLIVITALVVQALLLGAVVVVSHLYANRAVGEELAAAIADQRQHLADSAQRLGARQTASARAALQTKCDALARVLAGVVAVPLLTADQAGLDRPCAELLRDPDVAMAWVEGVPGGLRSRTSGARAAALAGLPAEAPAQEVARRLLARPGLVVSRVPAVKDGAVTYVAVVVAGDEGLRAEQAAITAEVAGLARETDEGWTGLRRALEHALGTTTVLSLAGFALLAVLGIAVTALAARRAIGALVGELDRLGQRVRVLVADLAGRNRELELALADGARGRALLDAVLQRMGEAVVVVDAGGTPLLWNHRARDLLDLRGADTRGGAGQLMAALCEADGRTPLARGASPVDRALAGEAVDDRLLFLPGRPGMGHASQRWLAAGARPLHHADGSLRGAVLVLHDITELRRANEGLELAVAERTRELHEAQARLVDAARRAGKAEVASEVLHNVGNLLTSLNVAAVMIGERLRGSAGDRVAELAVRAATDPALRTRLPDHLTVLARILAEERHAGLADLAALRGHLDHVAHIVRHQQETPDGGPLLAAVEVLPVVEDALLIALAGLADPPLVERRFPPAPPVVRTDRHRLLQILVNLLLNARHACAGGAPLRLAVTVSVAAGRLRVVVADRGAGIAAEHLPRLFDLGFTTRAGGHGIGLHTSANAARLLGGTLAADSAGPGHGAEFTLDLPA